MIQQRIKLGAKDVESFVAAASKCDFDVDIFYNHYIVDAKSLLGVFGLDLTRVLTVSYNGYNADFEHMLRKQAVAS